MKGKQWDAALSWVFIAGLIGFEAWYMTPGLFRTWFFSSDEYVIVAEVIRFLHLDFHQQFFDMPGTPLMLLSAFLWAATYGVEWTLGLIPRSSGLEHFTFGHLPQLFTLMRGETLVFALVSIVLVFILACRITNRAGACAAALILMMSPVYNSYSSFIRVESLSVCLELAAVLAMLHALNTTAAAKEQRWILFAGILAGLGAAARLHSVTASLPLLLMLLIFQKAPPFPYELWLVSAWSYARAAAFAVAVAAVITIKTGHLPGTYLGRGLTTWWPKAFVTLTPLFVLVAVLVVILWMTTLLPWTRAVAARFTHPRLMVLIAGYGVGLLMGVPTLLWQYRYFLQSINMYTVSYIDRERMTWPLLKNVRWFLSFYLKAIAPDRWSLILLGIGALLILLRRDKRLLPFLAAGAFFFVSKPINLIASEHHVILWLPFYSLIAGYAVAVAYDAVPGHKWTQNLVKQTTLIATLIGLWLTMVPGPVRAASNTAFTEQRLHHVAAATEWIHHNTPSNSAIAIAYFCFNSDVFYAWLRSMDVPVPQSTEDGRHYIIWWCDRSALKRLSGFACVMPGDIATVKHSLDLSSPGEGVDPYSDAAFKQVASFGEKPSEVDVFHFDFTGSVKGP